MSELLVFGYVVGYLISYRKIAGWLAYDTDDEQPGGDSLLFGIFFGLFCTLAWPIVVSGWYIHRAYVEHTDGAMRFFNLLVSPPKAAESRTAERERLQERITDLERELGISE